MKALLPNLSPQSAARTAAIRLLLAWLPLSMLIGAAAWYYETERLEHRVLADAVLDAHKVTYDDLDRYSSGALSIDDLHDAARRVLGEFVSVEIYGVDGSEIAQELNERANLVSPELWAKAEGTPLTAQPSYLMTSANGRKAIVTVVPIENAQHTLNGYLKGIYIVTDAMLAEMRDDSIGAMVIAALAVFFTMLVVFPIILFMQRQDREQTNRILRGNITLLEVLGNAVAHRDSDTDAHNYRVTLYAVRLGRHAGLSLDQIRIIIVGAFLHDIGKIGISDAILHKPGKLTASEFEVMKTHVDIGLRMVRHSPWLMQAASVVESHHEKFDGSGYPQGLAGVAIPVEARIFAVIDVFDALTSSRPYKEPLGFEQAMSIIRSEGGRHFDPDILARFDEIAASLFAEIGQASYESLRDMLHECVESNLTSPGVH